MNIIFFLIIIFSFYAQDFSRVFWFSLIAGLAVDFWFANLIGFSSLIMMVKLVSVRLASFLIFLYRRKFSSAHILFQLVFVLFFNVFFNWLEKETVSLGDSGVFLILTLIIFIGFNKFRKRSQTLVLEV